MEVSVNGGSTVCDHPGADPPHQCNRIWLEFPLSGWLEQGMMLGQLL